jgi:hypothetical protein
MPTYLSPISKPKIFSVTSFSRFDHPLFLTPHPQNGLKKKPQMAAPGTSMNHFIGSFTQ